MFSCSIIIVRWFFRNFNSILFRSIVISAVLTPLFFSNQWNWNTETKSLQLLRLHFRNSTTQHHTASVATYSSRKCGSPRFDTLPARDLDGLSRIGLVCTSYCFAKSVISLLVSSLSTCHTINTWYYFQIFVISNQQYALLFLSATRTTFKTEVPCFPSRTALYKPALCEIVLSPWQRSTIIHTPPWSIATFT